MQKLNPKSIWLFFVSDFLFILFLVGLILTPVLPRLLTAKINIALLVISALAAILTLSYIVAYFSYYFYSFELTDSKVYIKQGIIFKKYTNIPYGRIQNTEIYRGVLDRFLGLSRIMLHTAGGGGGAPEGVILGLEAERAEAIIKEIESKAGYNKSSQFI